MAERVIKHKAFRYYVETPSLTDPDGTVLRQRVARRGEKVDLREVDAHRGDQLDAFYTEAELKAQGGEEVAEADASGKSVNDLIDWLEEEKPTAPQTINAANGDPEVASRLLEAEESVTGRQPRSTVTDALEKIIDDAEDDDDDDDTSEDADEPTPVNADMSRNDLNRIAAEEGVDNPEGLSNRQEVVAAIQTARNEE